MYAVSAVSINVEVDADEDVLYRASSKKLLNSVKQRFISDISGN